MNNKFLVLTKIKVLLPGLIFSITSFGISGDLLELIKNFPSNWFLRVFLNGQTCEWEKN